MSDPKYLHDAIKFPPLKWHHEYNKAENRVLMMEYHGRDSKNYRKVTAQEIWKLEELESVYRMDRNADVSLRVFHVQNSPWGEDYLQDKFNLDFVYSRTGGFPRWVKERIPPRRAGKLMMRSRTWKTRPDLWRKVATTAFGMDYMKASTCKKGTPDDLKDRVLGLQGFGKDGNAIHAYDIFSQRLSVYVQYKNNNTPTPDADSSYPYGDNPESFVQQYDNGNTIIIFENSHSLSTEDTLISARGHWEAKWRRLPFSVKTTAEDTSANLVCMKVILQDILKSVVSAWEKVLDVSWEHMSILEDAIYEQPADESRAPELWRNSANWLQYKKLMIYHKDTMNEMRRYLAELPDVDVGDGGKWLDELPSDFDRLEDLMQEDLVKPTANLSELMYRSVGIRDSRATLQIGSSMWRLSWITFIFLPATFMVGFFGMNVQTFNTGAPSIKWFFVALIPFFCTILLGWYLLKHLLARHRRDPIQRGLYEALYTQLEGNSPSLWSRQGPRDSIEPDGWKSRIKWKLIQYWTKDTLQPTQPGEWGSAAGGGVDMKGSIGAWNRLKTYLMRKWTGEIKIRDSGDLELGKALPNTTNDISIAMVPDDNGSAARRGRSRSSSGSSTSRRHSQRRRNASTPLSPSRSNQILVEELNEGPEAAEGAEGLAAQGGTPVGHITQRAEAVKYA